MIGELGSKKDCCYNIFFPEQHQIVMQESRRVMIEFKNYIL